MIWKCLKNTDSLIFTFHFTIYCSIKQDFIIRNTSSFLSYFTVFVFPHPFCPGQSLLIFFGWRSNFFCFNLCFRSVRFQVYCFALLLFPILDKEASTFCDAGEDKVNIGALFGWNFIKRDFFAFSVLQSALFADHPLFFEIDLIADYHCDDIAFDEIL